MEEEPAPVLKRRNKIKEKSQRKGGQAKTSLRGLGCRSFLCIHRIFGIDSGPLVLQGGVTGPHGAQDAVPESEVWLRKVGLDTPTLVVNVVVSGIVARHVLERIPRQGVATVVVNCLHGGEGEEEHALFGGQERQLVGKAGADGVE